MTDLFPTQLMELPELEAVGENVDTMEPKEVIGKSTEYCAIE